VLKALLALKV
jgi:hypothetical protein